MGATGLHTLSNVFMEHLRNPNKCFLAHFEPVVTRFGPPKSPKIGHFGTKRGSKKSRNPFFQKQQVKHSVLCPSLCDVPNPTFRPMTTSAMKFKWTGTQPPSCGPQSITQQAVWYGPKPLLMQIYCYRFIEGHGGATTISPDATHPPRYLSKLVGGGGGQLGQAGSAGGWGGGVLAA